LTSVILFATSANGQTPGSQTGNPDNTVAAAHGPRPNNAEDKAAAEKGPVPGNLEDEVAAVKAENATVREQLRKMEEQQRILLEIVDRLQRLDGGTATDVSIAGQPFVPATTADV